MKASLAPVHKNILPLTVAIKSIKPVSGSPVRDELLREAALGALFDHRNVVWHSPFSISHRYCATADHDSVWAH
jgi:hypothetical protein